MCLIEAIGIPIWNKDFLFQYTLGVFICNVIFLSCWIFELIVIRRVIRYNIKSKSCSLKMPLAFVVVLLSLFASFISSTFFLISSSNPSSTSCIYAPITAIIFRFISKHFIWTFSIVRGRMVMETLQSEILNRFTQHSPYIIITQLITIISMLLVFSDDYYDVNINECRSSISLWLIISVAFIGEVLYGLVFFVIFYKAMSQSMQRVMDALTYKDRLKTKKQLMHHLIVYFIQFILSSLYIINIASCTKSNTFTTFDIFEAELLLSNILILTLFRGRIRLYKKRCNANSNRDKQRRSRTRRIKNHQRRIKHHDHDDNDPPIHTPQLMDTGSNNPTRPMIVHANINKSLQINSIKELEPIDLDLSSNNDIKVESPSKSCDINKKKRYSISVTVNPLLPNSWMSPLSVAQLKFELNQQNNVSKCSKSFQEIKLNINKINANKSKNSNVPDIPTIKSISIGQHSNSDPQIKYRSHFMTQSEPIPSINNPIINKNKILKANTSTILEVGTKQRQSAKYWYTSHTKSKSNRNRNNVDDDEEEKKICIPIPSQVQMTSYTSVQLGSLTSSTKINDVKSRSGILSPISNNTYTNNNTPRTFLETATKLFGDLSSSSLHSGHGDIRTQNEQKYEEYLQDLDFASVSPLPDDDDDGNDNDNKDDHDDIEIIYQEEIK